MSRFCVFILALVIIISPATAAGHWDYENPDRDWPGVNVECAGQRQSPVAIVDNSTVPTTAFLRQYQSRLASFDLEAHNNGHSVEIVLDTRQLYLSSSMFPELMQAVGVHWHGPSEHRIDGKQYTAEMHVVYQPIDRSFWQDGRPPITVMGYLLDELDDTGANAEWQRTHNDSLLNEILKKKEDLAVIDRKVTVKFVPRLPFFTDFYVYEGSLTTPPCNETVMWWLAAEPIKVPKKQLTELSALLRQEHGGPGDARPIQPLNGRSVRKVRINAAQPISSTNVLPTTGGQTSSEMTTCSGKSTGTTMNFYLGKEQATASTKSAGQLTF